MAGPLDNLRAAVHDAAEQLIERNGASAPQATLERPRRADFGDYSTNAAMLLAPVLKAPPREIAQRLGDAVRERLADGVERVEIAGPGFLNLFVSHAWCVAAARHVLGDGFGGGGAPDPEYIQIEFVSTNPTGPLHVGHARNGAYGDALARILAFHGHRVEREFYVNDYGTQVLKLGESIQARARGEEPPEDGYKGGYVTELAQEIPGTAERPLEEVARAGVDLILERMRSTLHDFRVDFDTWFSERSVHEGDPSPVQHAFERLAELGQTYRSDDALWLRTTAHGDDKDRVLVRSTGEHTYFASDIAYHLHKRERGYDRLIDIWGADHHGYIGRMKAAFEALGGDPDRLELAIMQFVHLVARGERAAMSKRRGELVTLDDLMREIGVDASRWFLLARSHDTTVELDLDLAREQSNENPVYYVQYAHARIASMLRKAGEERVAAALAADPPAGLALDPAERELIFKLLAFPGEVADAADRRAPHRIAAYALELAQTFTAFYRDCRVVGATPEAVESFRIALSVASQRAIARALDLLGVAAPDAM